MTSIKRYAISMLKLENDFGLIQNIRLDLMNGEKINLNHKNEHGKIKVKLKKNLKNKNAVKHGKICQKKENSN